MAGSSAARVANPESSVGSKRSIKGRPIFLQN